MLNKISVANTFYLPPTVIPLTNIVGEFVEYLNSKSSAKIMLLNISLKLPATVIH